MSPSRREECREEDDSRDREDEAEKHENSRRCDRMPEFPSLVQCFSVRYTLSYLFL